MAPPFGLHFCAPLFKPFWRPLPVDVILAPALFDSPDKKSAMTKKFFFSFFFLVGPWPHWPHPPARHWGGGGPPSAPQALHRFLRPHWPLGGNCPQNFAKTFSPKFSPLPPSSLPPPAPHGGLRPQWPLLNVFGKKMWCPKGATVSADPQGVLKRG